MAAGLGFKDFTTGEVLTAADVDGYLMQGVWVFASAAARDAAVTSPQEGNFAYLKDTNVTTYYTGSAWANLDTTGMTNPMTTTGDTIYSSSGSTPARLGIGTTGQVLTVSGGVPSWATPAGGGGMTLLSTTTLSGTTVNISSISQSYTRLYIVVKDVYLNTAGVQIYLRFNGDGSSIYNSYTFRGQNGTLYQSASDSDTQLFISQGSASTTARLQSNGSITIDRYATSDNVKHAFSQIGGSGGSGDPQFYLSSTNYQSTSGISSLNFIAGQSQSFSGGTVYVYGVN